VTLRIGYLVQQFPPEVGAGPARVTEMARRWVDAGAAVTVFTGMPNRPEGRIHPGYRGRLFMDEQWEGVRVLRSWLYASPRHGFARTLLNNTSFMLTSALRTLARGGELDVLIARSPPFFPHLAGRAAAALRRVPLVLEVRDLWPDYLAEMGVVKGRSAQALFALERRLLQAAAQVVVVTESFRERMHAKGVDPARVHVIPNGVETSRYYRDPAAPPPLEALRRREGEWLVGYLGNFGAGQDLDRVLDAAELLGREDPRIRFVLVGDGPHGDALRSRAATLPNVSVLPPIAKEATRAFYNACDLCLVPLAPLAVFQETVPSKLFEIMACERPLLASLEGEGRAIVEASGGGLVRRPGDPAGIADGIRVLRASSEAERARMGAAGRAYVQEHYSRAALADRYLEILQSTQRPAHGAGHAG
jgi:glycosyltransferase involved in cell wall biosynthesis